MRSQGAISLREEGGESLGEDTAAHASVGMHIRHSELAYQLGLQEVWSRAGRRYDAPRPGQRHGLADPVGRTNRARGVHAMSSQQLGLVPPTVAPSPIIEMAANAVGGLPMAQMSAPT